MRSYPLWSRRFLGIKLTKKLIGPICYVFGHSLRFEYFGYDPETAIARNRLVCTRCGSACACDKNGRLLDK